LKTILVNIKTLYTSKQIPPVKGSSMKEIISIDNAYLVVENGLFQAIGSGVVPEKFLNDAVIVDAMQACVVPGFVDSHTHLVHASSREHEFEQKLAGVPYLEILAKGGGILSTVEKTRKASVEELLHQARKSLQHFLSYGVTTLEAKSGYGLDLETEIKQLRVAKQLHDEGPIEIISTYMGAHAIPPAYKQNVDAYVTQIIHDLDHIYATGLAEMVDVFCEEGVFSIEQTTRILTKARSCGFGIRLHADEIHPLGGGRLASSMQALSADHLMALPRSDYEALANSRTIATLLPGTSFYLNKPFAKAREMVDANMALAIASDYNPGSSPSENFAFTLQLASNKLGLLPSEVLTASTINPAFSLRRHERIGSIEVGKQADFVLLAIPNWEYFLYHYGTSHTQAVYKRGICVYQSQRGIYETH
jgi:imidazolonepropionase